MQRRVLKNMRMGESEWRVSCMRVMGEVSGIGGGFPSGGGSASGFALIIGIGG